MNNLYKLEKNDYRLMIMMVEPKNKDKVLPLLIRCLCKEDDLFFCINQSKKELSFIIDKRMKKYFRSLNCVYYPDTYRPIQIHENCSGIDHIGIVSEISSLLSDINISMLYINTFNNNFILVKDKDYNNAIKALNSIDIN